MLNRTDKERIITKIDARVNHCFSQHSDRKQLLLSLHGVMDDFKKILDYSTSEEVDAYCQRYNGFYKCAKIFEQLAAGIANGSIPVPEGEPPVVFTD